MESKETNKAVVQDKPTGNKNNKFMMVIIILLLGFCGYLIWQNLELKKAIDKGEVAYTEVSTERDQVQAELEEMLKKYEDLETDNQELSAELAAEKAKIEELIKKAKGKDWTIYQLKKETETLRKIMKGYVVQIDSLNQLNNKLTDENKTVKNQLSNEQQKAQELNEKNEDINTLVNVASTLKNLGLKS